MDSNIPNYFRNLRPYENICENEYKQKMGFGNSSILRFGKGGCQQIMENPDGLCLNVLERVGVNNQIILVGSKQWASAIVKKRMGY